MTRYEYLAGLSEGAGSFMLMGGSLMYLTRVPKLTVYTVFFNASDCRIWSAFVPTLDDHRWNNTSRGRPAAQPSLPAPLAYLTTTE